MIVFGQVAGFVGLALFWRVGFGDAAGASDFVEDVDFKVQLFFKNVDLLVQRIFFFVKHLEKGLVLNLILYVGILSDVGAVFDDDVETSSILPLVIELNVVVIFVVRAVCQQHFDYLYQKLPDTVDDLMGILDMLFQGHPAALDDFIVED